MGKIIGAIEKIFNRDNRAALTNHIFSVYDILNSAFINDHGRTYRPYSNILVPAMDSISDLKNELMVLKDSIRSIMQMVIKITETNELGQFLIKDAGKILHMSRDFFRSDTHLKANRYSVVMTKRKCHFAVVMNTLIHTQISGL